MRGKAAPKRKLQLDRKYNNLVVTKTINYLMIDGKKAVSEAMVYNAIEWLGKELKIDPLEAFLMSIEAVKPKVEVRSRRVGGANYQVPMPIREERQLALALRWIRTALRDTRGKRESWEALAQELIAATRKEGYSYKKKEDTHRMAEANKAFSHLTW